MVRFITTNDISYQIREIFRKANNEIIIISPFLKISQKYRALLKEADERGVKIQLVYGKKYLNQKEYGQLFQFKNLEVYYYEDLHAKCYFNETKMVITSMNLHEYSERNNFEMGVAIETGSLLDNEIYENAAKQSRALIKMSKKKKERFDYVENGLIGFCIICREPMPFDDELHYIICNRCWKFGKRSKGKFCHSCGRSYSTFKEKPLCLDCYKKFISYL